MAISFADKNRNAAVGAPEGQLTADNINEIKREVNILALASSGATISVQSKTDFPAAVGGVITLEAGKTYRVSGNVSLGTDRIDTNGAALVGSVSFPRKGSDKLIYTGTGTMLTCSNNEFLVAGLDLECNNGKVCDLSGTNTERVRFSSCKIDAASLGDFDDLAIVILDNLILSATTTGFTFANSVSFLICYSIEAGNVVDKFMDFGTSTINFADFELVNYSAGNGEYFIDGLANGANFALRLNIRNCIFINTGTGAVFNNITKEDDNVQVWGNYGISDTDYNAASYVAQGDEINTVISGGDGDAGNPKIVAGTFTVKKQAGFTCLADGSQTFDVNIDTDFIIRATLSVAPVSGSNKDITTYIAIDGVVDPMSRKMVTVSSGSPKSVTMFSLNQLTEGQVVAIFIENSTDTVDLIASSVQLLTK